MAFLREFSRVELWNSLISAAATLEGPMRLDTCTDPVLVSATSGHCDGSVQHHNTHPSHLHLSCTECEHTLIKHSKQIFSAEIFFFLSAMSVACNSLRLFKSFCSTCHCRCLFSPQTPRSKPYKETG